jgi:hypothetical protein
VEGQAYPLPCDFLQLTAGWALGALQQGQSQPCRPSTQPACSTHLDPRQLSVCPADSWPHLTRAMSGAYTCVGNPLAVCYHHRSFTLLQLEDALVSTHSVHAAGYQWPSPRQCKPPHCCAAPPMLPPSHLACTLRRSIQGISVAPRCQRYPCCEWARHWASHSLAVRLAAAHNAFSAGSHAALSPCFLGLPCGLRSVPAAELGSSGRPCSWYGRMGCGGGQLLVGGSLTVLWLVALIV